MFKKISILFLLLFIILGILKAQSPPPPFPGPNETWTYLWSVSYDYQANGSVRYLVQDPANPANWCAMLMAQQDSNSAPGDQRYIFYSYSSTDNGNTWAANVLDASTNYGFPCMTLRNGVPVIAAHKSSAPGPYVFQDSSFGAFAFEQIPGIPIIGFGPIWPHIAGTTNGNLVLAATDHLLNLTVGQRTTYNGTSWSPWVDLLLVDGPPEVASGPNGKVAITGMDNFGSGALAWYQSIDNGNTFDNGNVILPYIPDGSDTLFANPTGGYQAVYDNNGVAHIVFAAYNINPNAMFPDPHTIAYVKPGIYHWSSAGGAPVKIAGRENIPTLTDTVTQALNPPLTQPTITRTASGKLVCAFTTFLRGNTQVVQDGSVVNAGEIFVTASSDNGATWGSPVNLTNTPNVEEKHSSLAPTTNTDSVRIYYVRDMRAGGWVLVQSWGKAPVYGIFKKAPPPPTIGIKENISQAKTYELFQNYPNPFNPGTTISYYIQKTGFVSLKVYDIMGREIAHLVNNIQTQGTKEITFNGSNLASGIYYYKLQTDNFSEVKKMTLLK
jgi:hypothetical protein